VKELVLAHSRAITRREVAPPPKGMLLMLPTT